MYVLKLNQRSSTKGGVYVKDAIIVSRDFDEYTMLLTTFENYHKRIRRRRINAYLPLTSLLPLNSDVWVLYVQYNFANSPDWEQDIIDLVNEMIPSKGYKKIF